MIVNASSEVQHIVQIKSEIMMNANASVKNIVRAKKIMVGILSHVFVGMVKRIADTSVIVCDEIAK